MEDDGEAPGADDPTFRWHDNVVYGLSFTLGDPARKDWRSDLVFDIDLILEWRCGSAPGESRFRVAPVTLAFHQVADFSINVDQGNSEGRNALIEWSIDRVLRECLDRPFEYWRWTVLLNAPSGGRIGFCATGFTETLKSPPRWVAEQRLPRGERGPGG